MNPTTAGTGLTLGRLVRALPGALLIGDDRRVTGVRHDSRAVEPGDLFVAIPGASVDGAAYAKAAVERGAVAVLTPTKLDLAVPQIVAPHARRALGTVAELVYGNATEELRVVGITGTNGKTTTAWLVEAAIAAAGGRPAILGTVGIRGPGIARPATHTTPEGDDIARFAREVLDRGADHLVMEVSSHALALHRVDAVHFSVAAFTNLTQDHLDFHGDLESYFAAKARLFLELSPEVAVVSVDDPYGARLASSTSMPTLRCSRYEHADADVRVLSHRSDRGGLFARVQTPVAEVQLESPLVGAHNLDNLLTTLGIAIALELDLACVVEGLSRACGAPGRLERVPHPGDVAVFVDYAHTADALARVLSALRSTTPGRLIVVFGCGGDRDRGKRPEMGRAAIEGADVVFATSDNPRTEEPLRILDEVERGMRAAGGASRSEHELRDGARGYFIEPDRRTAIERALRLSQPGDTVLLAGKGHETEQILGRTRVPFDDRVEAAQAIARTAVTEEAK